MAGACPPKERSGRGVGAGRRRKVLGAISSGGAWPWARSTAPMRMERKKKAYSGTFVGRMVATEPTSMSIETSRLVMYCSSGEYVGERVPSAIARHVHDSDWYTNASLALSTLARASLHSDGAWQC